MSATSLPPRLIINADDYGYFQCVSRGIITAAKAGALSATGIMANSSRLQQCIELLEDSKNLDIGIHLNITHGEPLTSAMSHALQANNGKFTNKFTTLRAILSRKIPISTIIDEWRAQILCCIDNNITIRFINSHEHLHMFPPLFRETIKLAQEFNIPHIRFSTAEWRGTATVGSLVRNILMQGMTIMDLNAIPADRIIPLLGMNESGKLSADYLKKVLPTLKSGYVYELMCHPGFFDPDEIHDPDLLNYHRWQSEFDLLVSDELKTLYRELGIELTGYRHLRP